MLISENNLNKADFAKKISDKFKADKSLEVGFFETAKYDDGTYVAQVAYFNEFGTLKIPMRPFFRNAINSNNKKWFSSLKQLMQKNQNLELSLNMVGELAKGDIIRSINSMNTPANSQSTIKYKKSSKPLVDTGLLRSSVTYRVV